MSAFKKLHRLPPQLASSSDCIPATLSLSCPTEVIVAQATNPQHTAVVEFGAGATIGTDTVTCSQVSGNVFPFGNTSVTCRFAIIVWCHFILFRQPLFPPQIYLF